MLEGSFSALERCRLFVSSDVEETQSRIAEVMQPHQLRPRGRAPRHRAHMDFVRLADVGVGRIAFGEMALELEEVEDYHLVIFCRQGAARFVAGGRQLRSDNRVGACFAPGERVKGEFSTDCEQIVLRIDAQALSRCAGTRRPRLHDQIDLARSAMQPWARFASGTFDDPVMVDLLATDRRVAASCESLLLSLWLSGGVLADEPTQGSIAPASIKRAEAYIDAYHAEPIALQDIADVAGVPVRTLLDGFRRFRGATPMAALKQRRLMAARAALLAADSRDNVLGIALAAGFTHHGRFSSDYAERFGEPPSATLRRPGHCQT